MISKSSTNNKQSIFDDPVYRAKLNALQYTVCLRLNELFAELAIEISRRGKLYMGPCPIHGGDNISALNLYHTGDNVPGYWRCNTRHCEKFFKPTIIGFVRGVLSHQKHKWSSQKDKQTVGFTDTVKWLCKFVGTPLSKIEINEEEIEKRQFAAQTTSFTKRPEHNGATKLISRERVRQTLEIPADFFVSRGYSQRVLDTFDVGYYPHRNSAMSERVVVPIYDDVGKMAVGFTGRSIHQQCVSCKRWHRSSTPCPISNDERQAATKWRNSKGVNAHSFLYNFWNAKKHIRNTGTMILVEGPPDVWRLWESGVFNVCGLFGCEMTDEQRITLERSGAMKVVLLLDNDEPGRLGCEDILKQLERSYGVIIPKYDAKDVGELQNSSLAHLLSQLTL